MAGAKKSKVELPWPTILEEATTHLSRLIQIDTTNPNGNELPAAQYLADVLRAHGLDPVVVEPAPGRGSVIARLKGSGEKPPLLLLSHLDVVPATKEGWLHDPFGGEVAEGEIWGRGALDCKGLAAAWLELVLVLKRTGYPLERDIIFAATADEEMGGTWGVKWLVENRFDLIQAEYALNEGGGLAFRIGQQVYYTYQTAEKAICWVRLRAKGTGGHASIPLPDNPLINLSKAITALGTRRLPVHLTSTTSDFINALAAKQPEPLASSLRSLANPAVTDQVLKRKIEDQKLALMFNAMLRNTASPTIIRAGEKTNVIPTQAEAEVDCRILPGQTPESLRSELELVLGKALARQRHRLEVEFTRTSLPTESEPQTPLTEAIKKALAQHAPQATLVPYLVPGATDARFLRPKGMIVYGFWPTLPQVDHSTVHGLNERLSLASFDFALRLLWDVVTGFAGK